MMKQMEKEQYNDWENASLNRIAMVVQVLRFANYFEFAFMDPSCNKISRQDQIYYPMKHFVE